MTKYAEWKIWNGGENPCPGKRVQYQTTSQNRQQLQDDFSDDLRWSHKEWPGDIIAYREVVESVQHLKYTYYVGDNKFNITIQCVDGEIDKSVPPKAEWV